VFADGAMSGLVVDVLDDMGGRLIQFTVRQGSFLDIVHSIGEMPLPPYITAPLADAASYQTVFARDERSAAAPTAGLHFTPALLDRCTEAGATIEQVELDVGLDTFRPVSDEDPTRHRIHTEHFRVPSSVAAAVEKTRSRGGRVIAVGTTSVRALESAWDPDTEAVTATEGSTSLYILPGYHFNAVDAVITNFHVPRSTLIMMMSAFASRELLMRTYAEAMERRYRFLSFGDAMLIL
jgi:S-adenosylmethionine:tRNA ribosyltransferase-isomerase